MLEIDLRPKTPRIRLAWELERLEPRRFLTIVPIDATAGVPFEGIVATQLRLPAYATGPELMNVMINGQWVYEPNAIVRADGTIDLSVSYTPQGAGTGETSVWFRNDRTGGWDLLETGQHTIKPNHFNALHPDWYPGHRLINGAAYREPIARFNATDLAGDLADYTVEVNWFGQLKTGRLVRAADGTVEAFVDNAYLPTGYAYADVSTTIRLQSDPTGAPKGLANAYISVSHGVAIGMFYGEMTSDTDFRIDLPLKARYEGVPYHFFDSIGAIEGWPSTFRVELTWQRYDNEVGSSEASVVRNADGSFKIVGTFPEGVNSNGGMIRVFETVSRPPVDGMPAETYTVQYVGSFELTNRNVRYEPPVYPPSLGEPTVGESPSIGGLPVTPVEGGVWVSHHGNGTRFNPPATDPEYSDVPLGQIRESGQRTSPTYDSMVRSVFWSDDALFDTTDDGDELADDIVPATDA